jgi:hypothetical protein
MREGRQRRKICTITAKPMRPMSPLDMLTVSGKTDNKREVNIRRLRHCIEGRAKTGKGDGGTGKIGKESRDDDDEICIYSGPWDD